MYSQEGSHIPSQGDQLESQLDVCATGAERAFTYKLDLYMRSHILPRFKPEQIRRWLSLSGGKDSFAMAEGLRKWYLANRFQFNAVPFTIDQWHGEAPAEISRQITWSHVQIIEANKLTLESTRYKTGQQAPCRLCSDVRRDLTDELIRGGSEYLSQDAKCADVVVRGLHLTDTSISALWRYTMGKDPSQEMLRAGKARGVSHLFGTVYLAKPLYYVREFESHQYARIAGYKHSCCGCAACRYPSRRDIVEESVAGFLRSPLWEFDVPGIEDLLAQSEPADATTEIQKRSEPGIETKHSHLPIGFARATVRKYVERWNSVRYQLQPLLDSYSDLDRIGVGRLRDRRSLIRADKLPMPSIFRTKSAGPYSDFHLMTIATMGPFWGAIGLEADVAMRAWEIQLQYFGVQIDDQWSQVGKLLREFYDQLPASQSREPLVRIAQGPGI
jgi:tRNA(Ile)-lysidine synthase TilS/MesJ